MDQSLEMPASKMKIEVAYAKPDQQCVLEVMVPIGCDMVQAIELSGILERFPEIDLQRAKLGVFGTLEKQPTARILQAGERVEIYRPLTLDPKDRRRQIAKAKQLAATKAKEAKARAANLAKSAAALSTDPF